VEAEGEFVGVDSFDSDGDGEVDSGEGSGAEVMSGRDAALLAKDPGVLATKGFSRDEWVAKGRELGMHEANRRLELGTMRDDRVRRAGEYAGWEWDGKPMTRPTGKRVQRSFPKKLAND
jgi:hypothetical protein